MTDLDNHTGGYVMLMCECIACKAPMIANPNAAPSIRVNGRREPLCRNCHARWNQIHRVSKGLEPIPLKPNAYGPELASKVL
jgi:hypothetical protein